jgi:hypothetical protein
MPKIPVQQVNWKQPFTLPQNVNHYDIKTRKTQKDR